MNNIEFKSTFDITSVKELFEILNKVEDILRGENNGNIRWNKRKY